MLCAASTADCAWASVCARSAGSADTTAIAATAGWTYGHFHLTLNPYVLSLDITFLWLFIVLVGGLGIAAPWLGRALQLSLCPCGDRSPGGPGLVFSLVGEQGFARRVTDSV